MKEWILNEKQGCILMEDLSFKSKCLSYFESVNLTQVRNIIEHLAHLHKNCLTSDTEKWKGKFLKNQTWLSDTIIGMEAETEPFLKKCGREKDFNYLIKKLKPFFLNPTFYNYVTQKHIHDLNIQPVLIHADLYPGNILWNTDKNGEIQNTIAAFIDWQLWCEGSPMADIARFCCQCCDGGTRRKAETFIIDFYLKCLTTEFNGEQQIPPYTREQLKKSYQLCFLSQAFQTLGMTTFMSANSQIKDLRILKANFDFGVLKALHAWEDCLWILEGDLKDIFKKFGK
uniref:CHK kinase-like domain-containing protein n=1 Tax=Panagrolaimus davidi TaxID=227884 RepID=A0A914PQ42_9BILA